MKLLSFIIPVYNCEGFLRICLESILKSGFSREETEIIFVDDASTDDSVDVLDEMVHQYSHVKVVRQDKSGPATARNKGLTMSEGEYVWFVDSDDRVVEGIAAQLLPYMRENVDLVAFNYRKVYSSHSEDIRNFVIAKEDSGVGCLEKMHPGLYLWDKIFKRSAIRERFIDNTYHIEDLYFNIINMIHLESVICLPVCGYEYVQYKADSISKRRDLASVKQANRDAYTVYSRLSRLPFSAVNDSINKLKSKVLQDGVIGHLYTMMNESPTEEIDLYIEKYRTLELYPIPKTDDIRKNLFLSLANRKNLFLLFVVIKRFLTKE